MEKSKSKDLKRSQILEGILEKSELTEENAEELSSLIKKSIREHHDYNF